MRNLEARLNKLDATYAARITVIITEFGLQADGPGHLIAYEFGRYGQPRTRITRQPDEPDSRLLDRAKAAASLHPVGGVIVLCEVRE